MKAFAIFLGFVLLLPLAACGERALDRLADGGRAQVAEAVSGDTVLLKDGRRLRLAGIEAPKGDAPYAAASRAALQRLVGGREVELLYGGARQDPFGTPVAQLRTSPGRRWVEGALLDEGAVRVRTFADNRALAAEMLEREARARRRSKGLWALAAYRVRLPDEIGPDVHGFQIVEGRVVKTGELKDRLYLDFSPDWRRVVSVAIPRSALRDFRAARIEPLALQGRLIRVRGPLSWRSGAPTLLVDHPEQIELLKAR